MLPALERKHNMLEGEPFPTRDSSALSTEVTFEQRPERDKGASKATGASGERAPSRGGGRCRALGQEPAERRREQEVERPRGPEQREFAFRPLAALSPERPVRSCGAAAGRPGLDLC